jgi:protocatechuate 3,4-dioxygenase beta subunit
MLIALLCAILFLDLLDQQPPQPQPQVVQASATVRGQVTDKETGAPLLRALVTVESSRSDGTRLVRVALTDQDGRFEIRELPSGFLHVSAVAGEHRATHVKEIYPPRSPMGVGRSLMLRDGEVRSDVNIALPRAVAVSGRVTDESGAPLAGLDIRLAPAGSEYLRQNVPQRSTDDRGLYRIFGVPPGDYIVCTEIRDYESRSRLRIGPKVDRFVNTCHPSSLTETDAQVVTVGSADLEGIDIQVRRSRTFTISGTIVDSTGAVPASPMIIFHRFRRDGSTAGGSPAPGGRFEFRDLVPGEYGVEGTLGSDPYNWNEGATERGYVAVTIDAGDVADLVVATKKPATVRGRVTFEDGQPSAREGELLTIEAQPVVRSSASRPRPVRVDDDLSFTLAGLFGAARLSVQGVPRGWVVKSIRYNGQDITGLAAEFASDPRHQVEVVLTSRLAIMTGTVTDDGGKPAARAMVFLLPADPRLAETELLFYRGYGAFKEGRFSTGGIRPGDYLVVALSAEQADTLTRQRPKVERLVKYGERVTLIENDRLTMNLRVVTLPDVR